MQSYLKISSVNLFLLSVLILAVGCTATAEAPPQVDTGTVMRRAQTDRVLEFEYSSSPLQESLVFVATIGGVGGDDGEFWTYYINNELAKEGCGTRSTKPGDSIRWVYGEPPEELN